MRHSHLLLAAAILVLSACSSSHRPVYSGHEESTEGVPGFVNGKKVSPHVKLGQSYTVDGETYVPRNQPDYVEEGLASWYGPGFHGGKTANGEAFDSNALTGAHRTLPLPSIVRVTLLSTGKSAYVRINDRGPFAHGRIIDLSRAAADKIGLLRVGVGKVRIEYMKKESERFADLLAQGRDPNSIDVASEVLDYSGPTTNYASNTPPQQPLGSVARHSPSFWDNFTTDANAAEPVNTAPLVASNETNAAAPVSDIASNDLSAPQAISTAKSAERPFKTASLSSPPNAPVPPPQATSPPPAPMDTSPGEVTSDASPFDAMEPSNGQAPPPPAAPPQQIAALEPANAPRAAESVNDPPAGTGKVYVQLGAFKSEQNAERLKDRYTSISDLRIVKKTQASGDVLYHVRTGPYETSSAGENEIAKLKAAGANDAKIVRE